MCLKNKGKVTSSSNETKKTGSGESEQWVELASVFQLREQWVEVASVFQLREQWVEVASVVQRELKDRGHLHHPPPVPTLFQDLKLSLLLRFFEQNLLRNRFFRIS